MKKLLLFSALIFTKILSSATIDVGVTIDGISKKTVFTCPTTSLKNNYEFTCACEQFALSAQVIESFDDGLAIEFKFSDKNDEVIACPIFRVVWGELAKLAYDANSGESVFFELTVVATK